MDQKDKLHKYLEENRLFPVMNNTKWRELIAGITSNSAFDPPVKIKNLFDEENTGAFTPVWWEQVEEMGYKYIEWMEIYPVKEERVGKMIENTKRDYTGFIQKVLEENSIPNYFKNGIFRINGYIKTT